jgi:hypothetical protein
VKVGATPQPPNGFGGQNMVFVQAGSQKSTLMRLVRTAQLAIHSDLNAGLYPKFPSAGSFLTRSAMGIRAEHFLKYVARLFR